MTATASELSVEEPRLDAEPPRSERRGCAPQPTVPGPGAPPLLGWRANALRFFRNPVDFMTRLHATYGELARLAPSPHPALFFRSRRPRGTYFAFGPKLTRQLLTDTETFQTRPPRGPDTRDFERLSTNLFFLNGARHKQQRRLFQPSFTRQSLQAYHRDMVEVTERMLDAWRPGSRVDLDHEMGEATLQIGSRTLYGLDSRRADQDLARRMSAMINALFSPATMLPLDLPGTPYRRLLVRMREIVERLEAEIERKRTAGAEGDDLLSMMVRAHDEDPEQLTRDELIGEAFTMFFAGHDTASKALVWTLFLLAQHPRVYDELLAELDSELGGGPPAYEQIYALPVLDRVVKESLRVLTPAVVFAREATVDAELGGFSIPAGAEVLYSPYVIHKDPAIFPEPKRFRPQRWSGIKPSAYEYLPFGVGARTCIGAAFGGMQLRIMVALIVQRCRLEIVPGTRIDLRTNVVIGPRNGLPAVVHSRDASPSPGPSEIRGYVREMVDL